MIEEIEKKESGGCREYLFDEFRRIESNIIILFNKKRSIKV